MRSLFLAQQRVTCLQNSTLSLAYCAKSWHQLLQVEFSGKQTLRQGFMFTIFIKECPSDQHLWKGRKGSRELIRVTLACHPQTTPWQVLMLQMAPHCDSSLGSMFVHLYSCLDQALDLSTALFNYLPQCPLPPYIKWPFGYFPVSLFLHSIYLTVYLYCC